ncbi:MAG TPA: ABC transporter ATP-binding protein [Acidimicrobiia bacterium]|nr:ABC transporter ATP-binding protein [Acidimicrobiia bacterium]
MDYELELRGITKRFPGVLANDHIDLAVRPGDIHAIVGENGAGKTTLMSILYGLVHPDEGEIAVGGRPVRFHSALDAIEAGLGMVHQAFKLFPTLTVAENVVFRAEPMKGWFFDRTAASERVRSLAAEYGLEVDPDARIEDLPVGVLQRVEILKALHRNARILILDEPTAVLTPQERDGLFMVMRRLKEHGHTILFITHKLGEVIAVADMVTVLRAGKAVAHLNCRETSSVKISRLMTGRDVALGERTSGSAPGDEILRLEGVTVTDEHGIGRLVDASLAVRRGEIVGVAGVAGNGQNELIDIITGLKAADRGTILINGTDVTHRSVNERRQAGLAYIPEDRHRVGTAAHGEVWANLLMGFQRHSAFRKGRWLRRGAVREHARRLITDYDVRVAGDDSSVATLSGGNLQKLVVAREMGHEAPLLIAEQPTRGVDVGAIEFIHSRLLAARDRGAGVLLVSAELWELLALADRILVMFEGRIVAELEANGTDEEELGLYMTGGQA